MYFQDVSWFIRNSEFLLQDKLNITEVPKEPYFVDFLQDAPEATGEEENDSNLDAPKIYEMVHVYSYIKQSITIILLGGITGTVVFKVEKLHASIQ